MTEPVTSTCAPANPARANSSLAPLAALAQPPPAGEDAVGRWEKRYGGRPDDEFVELISYRETREYVKAVIQHYEIYRQLYAPSASATSLGNPPKEPLDMMTMTSPDRAEATR